MGYAETPEGCEVAEIIGLEVGTEDAGRRLDVWLAAATGRSRTQVQRWISAGRVRVDGQVRKPGFMLAAGQKVEAEPLPAEPTELLPEPLPLDIVFEDPHLMVLNKPAGMVVHPGAGNRTGTLANALVHYLGGISAGDPTRPGIVHRLDKGTSGLLLVAKHETALERLAAQFKRREVEKVYTALVYGRTPPRGEIALAIGRDYRSRLRVSARTRRPKAATTRYEAIRYWAWATLVRVFPLTGRTHQIRVHFLHLGHPIVGDRVYCRRDRVLPGTLGGLERQLGRLFLHATSIRFLHPISGTEMFFEVPLPPELESFLTRLEQ